MKTGKDEKKPVKNKGKDMIKDISLLWVLMTASDGSVAMGEINCLNDFLQSKGESEDDIDEIYHFISVEMEKSPGVEIIERINESYTAPEKLSMLAAIKKLSCSDKSFAPAQEKLVKETCSLLGLQEADIV
ncbi:MAG: TerB family tellurite resistance protein [Candidatus Aureabacteria bacterium]|nr:TerB family tellurite resistance protein [Candidatus Auribacterota bacterium]